MAYLPCLVGPHPHRGRNVNLYLAKTGGEEMERGLGRVCTAHWDEIERWLAQFEVDFTSGALSDPTHEGFCLACFQPVNERRWQLFITSYPTKNERKDYWSLIHPDCSIPANLQAAVRPQQT